VKEAEQMRFFVKINVLDTIVGEKDSQVRHAIKERLGVISESGRLVDGGALAGHRAAYFIVNIDKPAEIYDLFAPLLPFVTTEVSPVVPFDELGKIFEQMENDFKTVHEKVLVSA